MTEKGRHTASHTKKLQNLLLAVNRTASGLSITILSSLTFLSIFSSTTSFMQFIKKVMM